MSSFIDNFFGKKNDNYVKAVEGLNKIKNKFDGFVMSFPDITPIEVILVKNKWEKLPSSISNGVEIMALKTNIECKTIITKYKPDSYVIPHKHKNKYEYGIILKGKLVNELTNKEYNVGDFYKFNPNELHYLTSNSEECLVYSLLSTKSNLDETLIPEEIEKNLNMFK